MRRYSLEVNGKTYTLDVDELAADRFLVVAGDQSYEVRLTRDQDLPGAAISPLIEPCGSESRGSPAPRPGRVDTTGRPGASVGLNGASGSAARVQMPGAGLETPTDSGVPSGGAAVLSAPMPGVILEIMAAPGSPVSRGEPVLILEAMKMRNTICAPKDSVVTEVLVQAGQTVRHGEALLRFGEPAS
jgi:biotin carboxyl carrier protein